MRFFLLLLFIHQGVLSQNTSLLWEVTKEGMKDTSYLYGSIHFPQKALVNANKKLHEIKFKVDAGCFEIIISPDSMAYFSYSLMAGKGDKVNDLAEYYGIGWHTDDFNSCYRSLISKGFELSEVRKGRKPGTLVSTLKNPMLGIPTILIGLEGEVF